MQNWRATCKTLSLSLFACEKKAKRPSRALHTTAYGTSNTAALHIQSDDLKNSTDRLTESETLKCSVSVFGEWQYICAKLTHSLQLTHWWVKSEHLLSSG